MSESQIDKMKFAFYSREDIQSLSTVEVTNPIAFDKDGNPSLNGLYDPAMGVSPYERRGKCFTCGEIERNCPGHQGHIKLEQPLYNIFFVNELVKLMRSKCFFCHRFTATNSKLDDFKLIMKMLHLGFFEELSRFEDFSSGFTISKLLSVSAKAKKNFKGKNGKPVEGEGFQKHYSNKAVKNFLKTVSEGVMAERKKLVKFIRERKDLYDTTETSFKKSLKYRLTKAFIKDCMDTFKCPHCEEIKSKVRKETNFKLIISHKSDKISKDKQKAQVFTASELKEHITFLFDLNKDIIDLLYGKYESNKFIQENVKRGYTVESFKANNFFLDVLLVTPNRFRPESKIGTMTFLHGHTTLYTKVLNLNNELTKIHMKLEELGSDDEENWANHHKNFITKYLELQETVNLLFDSSLNQKTADKETGIKQILEKKEGIFRMKIMGKRVNYSCRSVISPDPFLKTGEVGIPLFMVKKLTFPESVNAQNVEKLRKLIINGCFNYPGAVYLQENDNKIFLEGSTLEQRMALANQLLDNAENKVVFRHVQSGDVVLFNRQPTLHKPSIMSYKLRVLPKEHTIRMHYANCSGFNADFDGDEMNVHVLQNYLARSEGLSLSFADKQYILSTNKNPIRGLIQDFVFSCLFITDKELFLNKSDYCQLLYGALESILEEDFVICNVDILRPAILKPKPLWTGKQLFSNIVNFIAYFNRTGKEEKNKYLNIKSSTRVNKSYFCEVGKEEGEVIIRQNMLLCGIIDKNQIGASKFGLIHSFYELFGSEKTSFLFNSITKLCLEFMKIRGFSCGLSDLMLTDDFEQRRSNKLEEIHKTVIQKQSENFNLKTPKITKTKLFMKKRRKDSKEIKKDLFREKNVLNSHVKLHVRNTIDGARNLDSLVKTTISAPQSDLYKDCLTTGLYKHYPRNNFSCMVLSGAKGSVLNHSQISCNLGQQELEGKRVPFMSSGKTLPCWSPHNPNPRTNGYIGDRFLSGLRSQEFFFHCMAGREGLVDTAVKTSRSGYLQRMLVKNLESLVVEYDYSVRDCDDKSLVQYMYGDDCLDSTKVNLLENMTFLMNNYKTIKSNMKLKNYLKILKTEDIEYDTDSSTILENYLPYKTLGAISENARNQLDSFVKDNEEEFKKRKINPVKFKVIFYVKYFDALITPGDAVGAIAAQSFGEPSTQMTLNTFHLAGHGGANVTLGIPRLRELLNTKNTKNIISSFPFKNDIPDEKKRAYQKKFEKVELLELVKNLISKSMPVLVEGQRTLSAQERKMRYKIGIEFEDMEAIKKHFSIEAHQLQKLLTDDFLPKLSRSIKKISKKNEKLMKLNSTNQRAKRKETEELPKEGNSNDEMVEEEHDGNFFCNHNFKENRFNLILETPLKFRKVKMLNIIENVLSSINVQSIPGVNKIFLIKGDDDHCIQTEGLNFDFFWKQGDVFDLNRLTTNHIQLFMERYGIEGGRNLLIKELMGVFGHYGVKIDYRHCYLVVDYMTQTGSINPLSRVGIQFSTSSLLKMSFETTMKFLVDATRGLEEDKLKTPAASLVVGKPVAVGSGFFDIRMSV